MFASRVTPGLARPPFRASAFATVQEWTDLEGALERILARRQAIDAFHLEGPQPLLIDGICQACGAPRRFRAEPPQGSALTASDWPGRLRCVACGLDTRQRACIHFLLAETGRDPRASVVRVAGDAALADWLDGVLETATAPRRPFSDVLICPAPTPDAVAPDLKQLRPGGRLIAAVDDVEAAWALKGVLANHGLADWRGHLYWSEEFGYLGRSNVLVTASFR